MEVPPTRHNILFFLIAIFSSSHIICHIRMLNTVKRFMTQFVRETLHKRKFIVVVFCDFIGLELKKEGTKFPSVC